jgi:exodeoxyribonuclease VII small subunit
MTKDASINELLTKLEKTVQWFQAREEVDLDEGMKRAKEGAALVKVLKEKLKKIENEFDEIKKDLDVDNE